MVDSELVLSGSIEPTRSQVGRIKFLRSIAAKVIFFVAAAVFCLWQIAFVIFSLFLVLPELVPEMLLLGLYLVNLRDYALGMVWLLLIAMVAMGFWCALVFHERRQGDSGESKMLMAGSSIVFAVGVYVSLALLLFVVPLLSQLLVFIFESVVHLFKAGFYLDELWKVLVSLDWTALFSGMSLSFVSIPLMALAALAFTSMGLVLVLPFVLIYLYIGQFIDRLRQSKSVHNVLVRVLIDRQEQIRDGLINAYLSRYRYLSSTGTASLLTESYIDAFGIDRALAKYPQQLFNFLFKPILYIGDNADERSGAHSGSTRMTADKMHRVYWM